MASVQVLLVWLRRYPIIVLWIMLLSSSVSPVLPEIIYRVDPLALLAATLRTYQRAGCDSEQLSLSCPRGTSISIELSQYAKAGDVVDNNLCPAVTEETLLPDSVVDGSTKTEFKPPESCAWSNALQYTLLQTVVEVCQKKRHCKFAASPKTMSADPCPGIRKFVEIAYKCRPYEFRSKVGCENDVIQLVCNPYSRIAVYSASFGRTEYESIQCAQPQGVKEETCLASYATETVMQICHGRRRCQLSADSSTFGKPCHEDSRMYLKVVYTCVPRKVLKDRYETTPEPDESQQTDIESQDQDDLYDEDQFYKESEAIPPAPKLQGDLSNPAFISDFGANSLSSSIRPPYLSRENKGYGVASTIGSPTSYTKPRRINPQTFLIPKHDDFGGTFDRDRRDEGSQNGLVDEKETKNFFFKRIKYFRRNVSYESEKNATADDVNCANSVEKVEVIGFLAEWAQAFLFLAKNQEKFYLYLIVSVAASVLLCMILVIGRLLLQKRRSQTEIVRGRSVSKSKKFQQSTGVDTQLPNGFSDDISEIDDIDLTTPLPMPNVSRKDDYITYAASPSSYGSFVGPSNMSHTSTAMLVPSCGLMVTSDINTTSSGAVGSGMISTGQRRSSHQSTPPVIEKCDGRERAYSTLVGRPHLKTGTMGGVGLIPIGSVSHHTTDPSYLTRSLMVGHHGSLRRKMIPTSSGTVLVSSSPSPSPLSIMAANISYDDHPVGLGLPSTSAAGTRGTKDNSQYFYG